jgi:anti-sigma B factor antagonist
MLAYHHLGVWRHGDAVVVRFGDHRILDEVAIEKIGQELYAVADQEKCHRLILDLTGVERISTVMLGKLLMLNQRLLAKGGELRLCGLEPEVQPVFEMTKLNHILEICETESEALR